MRSSRFVLSLLPLLAKADLVQVQLPSGFQGPQSGIGSWYRSNNAQDYTNGHSWCGYTYSDTDPLFAPSLATMGGATYSSNPTAWRQQTQTYCGLEAKVTDPKTGKTSLLYIGDSFASPRTPGSIDIMVDAYTNLDGNPNGNKNTVIQNVQWSLTGRQNTQYTAPGAVLHTVTGGSPAGPTSAPSSPPGGGAVGSKCSNAVDCQSGLTCLYPSGTCSNQPCNWGCTGWDCSASVPCQLPNKCVSGYCHTS